MRRLLGLLLCLAQPAQAQSFGSPSRYTEQGGEAVYRGVCAACHMPDGRGAAGAGVYPSLALNSTLAQADSVIALVLRGRRAMPGFAATLTDQQIAAVVAFVRSHFGNEYNTAPDPRDVSRLR